MTDAEKEARYQMYVDAGADRLTRRMVRYYLGLPELQELVLDNTLPPAKVQPSANVVDLRGVGELATRYQEPLKPKKEKPEPEPKPFDPSERFDLKPEQAAEFDAKQRELGQGFVF